MLGGAASPVVVVGRGYSFPIALEVALKLREVGVRNAQGSRRPTCCTATSRRAADHRGGRGRHGGPEPAEPPSSARRPCARRGARTVVMSDDPALRESADIACPWQAATESLAVDPDDGRGSVAHPPGRARAGLDPDRPPGLTKIVRTV
jgi:glucosamine--fructose-6-phosphate aminotransferase (isomerizing)